MTVAEITALATGVPAILTALAALVRAFRTQSNLTAHVNDPGAHQ